MEFGTDQMYDWKRHLMGCFENRFLCIHALIFPCETFADNAVYVDGNKSKCKYRLLWFVPILSCTYGALLRREVREKNNIDGSFFMDLLTSSVCFFCAMIQVRRELDVECPSRWEEDIERY